MKFAEKLAWTALVGLLLIAIILLVGALSFHFTAYWAGMMLALGQAAVVGLAAWGLMLARQVREMNEVPWTTEQKAPAIGGTFRMSMGDDAPRSSAPASSSPQEGKTLDTGFQRLLTAISAVILLVLGSVATYFVYAIYRYSQAHPEKPIPVVGTFDAPEVMNELCLIIGLGAASIYAILWWISRPRPNSAPEGEAVHGNFTLGIAGMVALGVATILGYLRVAYASEAAAGILAALMLLQGFELIVNSMRSYASIEELDQEAIDLQAQPLTPMLSSLWLGALRMLFAQSVGLSREAKGERGVIARMMPRALVAMIIIAIGISCLRVVQPGTVAVLERLGQANFNKDGLLDPSSILHPGLHLTLPWPMDNLVTIPTEKLQVTDVGAELHTPKNWSNVDFQFWTFRAAAEENEAQNEFITGDTAAPQILETFVEVQWRVSDPARFYSVLSHSEFFDTSSAAETKTLPIYEAIVQECTQFAITRAFAIHSLDQIMISNRLEVERHCRDILQEKLDSMTTAGVTGSGIQVVTLTIRDLHPPFWRPDQPDPNPEHAIAGTQYIRGPASAFEFVVSAREYKEMVIKAADAERIRNINLAKGDADAEIATANAERSQRIGHAQAEAGQLTTMLQGMTPSEKPFLISLLERQQMYATIKDLLDPVTKIIVDPKVKDVEVYQTTENNLLPMRPPG